jgi:hypothetical protein
MAKKKGIERSKTTDKSVKADHSSQNIIQTVRVVVQSPKEPPKRKRKRASKSSSKGVGSVSKKEAIAELETVMTKFRALKDQAQKLSIKLPISIGESKFVPADIKTVADIQGLIAELRMKNSQIEALIQSPAQSGLSSQLPQQASSFAPQIVERSEPAKVPGQIPEVVPQVSPPQAPTTQSDKETQSDKDVEAALNAKEAEDSLKNAKVSDEDVEKATSQATPKVPGELNVEIDALKVNQDSTEQGNATTTTIGAEGREEVLAKMAADKDEEEAKEQAERLKMNEEDAIKFQLVRDKAAETMTDQELTTELTGDVNVTIAAVGLEAGPRVVKDAVDKLESIETDTQIDNQKILELIRVISVEANEAQKATPIQPEIVKKIKDAYKSETVEEYTGTLETYGNVSNVLTELEETLAKKAQDEAELEKAKKEQTLREQKEQDEAAIEKAKKEQDEAALEKAKAKKAQDEAELEKAKKEQTLREQKEQDEAELEKAKKEQDEAAIEKAKAKKEQDEAAIKMNQEDKQAEEDDEIKKSVQRMINGFPTKVFFQPGFSSTNVKLVGEGKDRKVDFTSLQQFLGDKNIRANEFTYLQMIGSLKDGDIVFPKKKPSLSKRNPTALVIKNVNKFYEKLIEYSLVKFDLEPLPAERNITYDELVRNVQSKLQYVVKAKAKETLPSVPTVPQSDPEKVANL